MLKNFVFYLFLSTLAVGNAYADQCTDMAALIGLETERGASLSEKELIQKSNFCSAEYSKATNDQRARIEGSYQLTTNGSAAISSTQYSERQAQVCDGHYGDYWSRQLSSVDRKTVSQIGADVVKSCLDAQKFRISSLAVQGSSVHATFFNSDYNDILIDGAFVTSENIGKCTVSFGGKIYDDISKSDGLILKPGTAINLNCVRVPVLEGNVEHYYGGLIGVNAEKTSLAVPLVEYAKPPLTESNAEQLRRKIEDVAQTVNALGRTQVGEEKFVDDEFKSENNADRVTTRQINFLIPFKTKPDIYIALGSRDSGGETLNSNTNVTFQVVNSAPDSFTLKIIGKGANSIRGENHIVWIARTQ